MATKHIADAENTYWVSNVTPDFCEVDGEVIPFDILQVLTPEKAAYTTTVFARGNKILLLNSIIKSVKGNAGSGVSSFVSLSMGDTLVEEGSSTVFIEGRKTARHLDRVSMNGVFPPGPAGGGGSGLGESVDKLIGKSPTLQKDLKKLKEDGWQIEYGSPGSGSYTMRDTVPPKIILDGNLKDSPLAATQTLAHEVGHATYPYVSDVSSKTAYVNGALADEGAATMKNIEVQREIIANGGADIGIGGSPANHASYNSSYDAYIKNSDTASARDAIGAQFGIGEKTSTTGQAYADYYGGWYNKEYPAKK